MARRTMSQGKGMGRVAKGGGSKTRIANLQKPPSQGKVGGVSTPFSNRIMPGMGGKR